jgi:hypothetical protein
MSETSSAYDLRNAMTEAGCPICRLKARDGERYLDSLLDESVNDSDVRRDLRESRGFCHRHAWQLVRPGAPLGIAIIHRDIVQALLKALEGASFQKPPLISVQRLHEAVDAQEPAAATAGLVERLGPRQACPACRLEEKMEGIYLGTLVENLVGEQSLLEGFKSSAGLCLPHLRQALALVRDRAVFEALVGAQRDIWRRLEADLGEFIRKSDYRFHGEPLEVEGDAWLRGIAAVSGDGTEVGT